ncbi:uncharacterized protein LOC106659663 [Trichogramma pretiosum]|uniref:uncharacterized protein LOC106659663 n=1 Tax=Trichogramma pretiosum TaxID=7493 RepID=UPI000C71AFD4|nr:uncharacterized protein LOC106659663 [Trichogramma pretiosum]
MSSSQDTCLLLPESQQQQQAEIDSEGGSSSGEQEQQRNKRLGSSLLDGLTGSSGGKKRRKQTTPVKFSTSLSTGEDEDDDEDDGQQQQPHRQPSSLKDENLNNEFRCQYCSRFFDDRDTLEMHLECEHDFADPSEEAAPVALASSEQTVGSPMNLSHISVKNFASSSSSWLPATSPGDAASAFFKAAAVAPARGNSGNHHYSASMPAGFPAGPFGQFMSMPSFVTDMQQHAQQRAAAAAQLSKFPKIFNPDAYCELCNKEFCNKYFLKTHKANKHNVYSDQSHSNDGLTNSPFVASSSSSPINKLRLESNGLQTSPSLPCDLCSKQFKNEESLRKHRNKVHFNRDGQMMMQQHQQQQQTLSGGEDEAGQSPGIMETLFKQEFSIDEAEITFTNKQRSSSSSVNGDKQQQQRLFLVMNPEAFCELCCKEYVDRHHLHAHRLKRHADNKPLNSSSTESQQQESPLNLIMADSSLNNGSSASDWDEGEEYACKMCGLRLQTQELFLLHVDKIHRSSSPRNFMLDEDSMIENQQKTLTTTEDAMMISEDLKKLQTMITQLSGLESNKAASCALCGKDYDNPAALRSHMIAEHSVVPENLASRVGAALTTIPQQQQQPQQPPQRGKVEEQSTTPQLVAAPISPMTPKSNSSQSMQDNPRNKSTTTSSTTTPTGNQAVAAAQQINSSFCTLCNKELCNKYFMKTHMQKMHGIEIENGAQIGGVVCNICKKELCSKYFLRVHKQNTHGITEDGQQTTTTTTTTSNKQEMMESPGAAQGVEDLALKPELLGDLNLRYITHFTEVCPICNRRFRSSKWLKLHLKEHAPPELDKWREMEQQQSQKIPNKSSSSKSSSSSLYSAASLPSLKIPNGGFESAANNSASNFMRADLAALGNQVLSNFFGDQQQQQQQGQQQQNYCCSQPQCNFSTTILPLYFLHERSHHQEMDEQRMLQCPICAQSFGQLEALREHVSARHPNPFPGLLSSLPLPLLGDFAMPPNSSEQQQRGTTIKSEDCSRTSPTAATTTPQQHIMNEIDTNQMIKQEESSGAGNNVVQVMPQGAYKCSQCGFASSNLNRIKKHVRKDHRCPGGADPVEQALAELNKMLKDVANKHKVPVSYAVPQLPPSQQQDNNGMNNSPESSKTVMQAFIVEEKPQQEKTQQQSNGGSNGCGDNNEEDDGGNYRAKRFAPALVFLPVKARVSDSLTLTFSLSPA